MISGCLLVTRRPAPVWDRLVGVAIAADGNVGAMISSLGSCHPDQLPIPFCRAAALGAVSLPGFRSHLALRRLAGGR